MIVFGTDGWRAVIADGFTFDNVRRVSAAIGVAARTLEPPKNIDRNALGKSAAREGGSIAEEDLLDDYVDALRAQIDVAKIRRAKLAILHDPIHGAAAQLPSRVLGIDYIGSARIIRRNIEPLEQTIVDGLRGDINPAFR